MNRALFLLCAAGACSPARAEGPDRSSEKAPDKADKASADQSPGTRALDAMVDAGEVTWLRPGPGARCETWSVARSAEHKTISIERTERRGRATITRRHELRGGETLSVRTHETDRTIGGESVESESGSCGVELAVGGITPAGIDLGNTRWFLSRNHCETARADRARLAFDPECGSEIGTVSDKQAKRRIARGVRVFRFGGSLYELEQREADGRFQCHRWRVSKEEMTRRWREGRDVHTLSYGLQFSDKLRDRRITLLGPGGTTTRDGQDVAGWGMGCASRATIEAGPRHSILLDGSEMFLTARACRRAMRAEIERARWFPDADNVAMATASGVPGC